LFNFQTQISRVPASDVFLPKTAAPAAVHEKGGVGARKSEARISNAEVNSNDKVFAEPDGKYLS